jgi:hypothetical protein
MESFIVICRGDSEYGERPGDYELATRQVFQTAAGARVYADGIAPSREPIVVPGRWHQLRFP